MASTSDPCTISAPRASFPRCARALSRTSVLRSLFSIDAPSNGAPSKMERTAIHEAGHTAIATMIHRGIVDEVFVSETAVDVTETYHEINFTVYGLTGGVRFRDIQTTVYENGLIAYSGFFAECESLHRSGIDLQPMLPHLREQASHDIDRYHALLAAEGLTEGEIQSVVITIGGSLKHYFDNGVWDAVRIIADALLERGRLTGEEILDLLPDFP